jgi:hypothetical protein
MELRAITAPGEDPSLLLALGTEEAVILWQPGGMFRATLDRHPSGRAAARFLTPIDPGGAAGMLALLPRAAAPALIAAAAGHPVERELQEGLWAHLTPAERSEVRR